jgi:hypothetical protein
MDGSHVNCAPKGAALPACTKACERKGCRKTAAGFVCFELTIKNGAHVGMKAILPFEWRCFEDSQRLDAKLAPHEWAHVRAEFSKRLSGPGEPELQGTITVGLSTFTEADVAILVRRTGEWGASTLLPELPAVELVDLDDPRLLRGAKVSLFGGNGKR